MRKSNSFLFSIFFLLGMIGNLFVSAQTISVGGGIGVSSGILGGNRQAANIALYKASELQTSGTLEGVSWYANTAIATARKVTIYLKETEATELVASSWDANINGLDPWHVTGDDWTNTAGWNSFVFDSAFNYSGDKNLLVIVHTLGTTAYVATTNVVGTQVYPYNNLFWSLGNANPITSDGTLGLIRPNIRFIFNTNEGLPPVANFVTSNKLDAFEENFDQSMDFPTGWEQETVKGRYDWKIAAYPGTAVANNYTYVDSVSRYSVVLQPDMSNPQDAWLKSSRMVVPANASLDFDLFYKKKNGTQYAPIYLYVQTEGETEWSQIWTSGAGIATDLATFVWYHHSIDLSAYTNQTVRFAWRVYGAQYGGDWVALDGVKITQPDNNLLNVCKGDYLQLIDRSVGQVDSWLWDLPGSEAGSSTIQNPRVRYNEIGKYDITLTATNSHGSNSITKTQIVNVVERSPISDFTVTNSTGFTRKADQGRFIAKGGTVSFKNISQNNPYSINWTFENGTPATSTEQQPTVTYSENGSFDVTLGVTNSSGSNVLTKQGFVKVGGQDSIWNIPDGDPGESMHFIESSISKGYLTGQNTYKFLAYSERFNNVSKGEISKVSLNLRVASRKSEVFKVQICTDLPDGTPGAILGSVDLPVSAMNDNGYTTVQFPTPVPISGAFHVVMRGFDDYSTNPTTVIIKSSRKMTTGGTVCFYDFRSSKWYSYASSAEAAQFGNPKVSLNVVPVFTYTDFIVDTQPVSFEANGGNRTINVNTNVNWEVFSSASWVTATKSGDNAISITCAQNNGVFRSATVYVRGGGEEKSIQVSQNGTAIVLSGSVNAGNAAIKDLTWTSSASIVTPMLTWSNRQQPKSGISNGTDPIIGAVRWEPADLSAYSEAKVTAIDLFVATPSDFTINIFNGNTLAHTQTLSGLTAGRYNHIALSQPVTIDLSADFMISFMAENYAAGLHPLVFDSGAPVPYKGDLISIDGGENYYDLAEWIPALQSGNWCFSAVIEGTLKESYHVYRDETPIATVTTTTYSDNYNADGYCYKVATALSGTESGQMSNTLCLGDVYDAAEIAALKAFLRQPSNAAGQINANCVGVSDTTTWNDNNAWVSNLSGVTFTSVDGIQRVQKIAWSMKNFAGTLNLSPCSYLTNLNVNNNIPSPTSANVNKITDLDISGCINLTSLYCEGLPLTSGLNLSGNINLSYLDAYSCGLTNLDLTQNTKLAVLLCDYNDLTVLDLSKNTLLTSVTCNSNQIPSLDLSANMQLTQLIARDNQIETLVMPDKEMSNVRIQNNKLRFSTLPSRLYATYNYAPQAVITAEPVNYTNGIDLSSEYQKTVNGTTGTTVFNWFDITDGNETPITLAGTNGNFTLPETMRGKILRCKMTNSVLPNFTGSNALVYEVSVKDQEAIPAPSIIASEETNVRNELRFDWNEGVPATSETISYHLSTHPPATSLLVSQRMDQMQLAIRCIPAQRSKLERVHAFVYYNNGNNTTYTVKILGNDGSNLPDLSNVLATFTTTAYPAVNGGSVWVDICPPEDIVLEAGETVYVVLTASTDTRLYPDYATTNIQSYIKTSLNTAFTESINGNYFIEAQFSPYEATRVPAIDGYNFYKNGAKLNASLLRYPYYVESNMTTGVYNYVAKAVYGGVESDPSPVYTLDFIETPPPTYDFENGFPAGCLSYDLNNNGVKFDVRLSGASGQYAFNGSYYLGTTSTRVDDAFVTEYFIPTSQNHKLTFYAMLGAARANTFFVKLSTTGRTVEDFTTQLDSLTLPGAWTKYSYDLSDYIGQRIAIGLFGLATDRNEIMKFDDITIPPVVQGEKDMQFISMSFPSIAVKDQPASFVCRIKNLNTTAANDVTVNIVNKDNNEVLATLSSITVDAEATKNVTLTWTPSQTGTFRIQGEVVYEGDTDLGNNFSPIDYINVQEAGSVVINLGNKGATNVAYPFNFTMKNSGSETIYFPNEINRSGALTAIALDYTFTEDILNQPVKIYVGETTQNDLNKNNQGYIDPSTLTKVFDGTLSFYKGIHSVTINFDQPFKYNKTNLAVAFESPFMDQKHAAGNLFYVSNSGRSDRTSMWSSDQPLTTYAQQRADAETKFTISHFPDIHFVFNTALEGAISGNVTDDNNTPLAGVTVSLKNTALTATTDADGNYTLPNINTGDYTLVVSKYPYQTIERATTVTAQTTSTENFSMILLPIVQVTGKVVDANTQSGISGAYVSLEDETKTFVMTDADGNFTFDQVFATRTYDLNIIADYYEQHFATVTVASSNVALGNIPMEVNLPAPAGVRAALSDDGRTALVNWDKAEMKSGFYEDFEKYQDFTLDIPPFKTVDVDQYKTGGFMVTNFPHAKEPMAFIVFNSLTTVPPMNQTLDGPLSYSGEKVISAFYTYDPARTPATVSNNDWIITPQTYIDNGMKLQFEAKTFRDYLTGRLECFEVWISTTGRDLDDFVKIASVENTPVDWTHYEYDLSAYNGQYIFAAIRCTSYDVHMFMVDDVRISNPSATESDFVGFNVYRYLEADKDIPANWTSLGTTQEKSYDDIMAAYIQGKFGYALVAEYSGNRLSDVAHSKLLTGKGEPLPTFTIAASATTGGIITPAGNVAVTYGANRTFTFTTNLGYELKEILVDGTNVPEAVTAGSYTFTNVTANHTIQAVFEKIQFMITAEADNNGTITPSGEVAVNYGENQTFAIAANAGYAIDQVLVDGANIPAAVNNSAYTFVNVRAPHTISATFKQAQYTITATAGAGGSITPSGVIGAAHGDTKTFFIVPNAGYKITQVLVDGIANQEAMSGSYTFYNIAASHTISATFEYSYSVITATAGEGGTIAPEGTTQVLYGQSQYYTITPHFGFKIATVVVDGTNNAAAVENGSYLFVNVTSDHSIAATFERIPHTIISEAGTGGSISPSGSTQVADGESQTYTITENEGYTLTKVLVDGINNEAAVAAKTYTFSNVTGNHTIRAFFEISKYTIEATAGENGIIAPTGTITVNYGGSKTYTFTPNAGYVVDQVLIDGTNDETAVTEGAYTFENVTENHTIEVSFKVTTLTITATVEGGNGTIDPEGDTDVDYGASQIYTFTPNEGYYIAEVLVDGVSKPGAVQNGSYTFNNVTTDHEIVVKFSEKTAIDEGEMATLKVYPNPTTGQLRITNYELKIKTVVVFDITGRLVLEVNNVDNHEASIDLSNYADGVYFIRVDGKTVKVIKK